MTDSHDIPGSEARFEVLTDVVGHMLTPAFVTDAGQETSLPRILAANDAAVGLTGFSVAEMLGKSPIMFARETIDESRRGEAVAAFREGRPFQTGTVQKRPDGTLYHVHWTMSPVHDADGAAEFFLWVQNDVSERVEAERMRDVLFEALNLSDDVVLLSRSDAIEFVNRGFLRLSGFEEHEVLGRPITDLDADLIDWRTLKPIGEVDPLAERMLIRTHGRRESPAYIDMASTIVTDPVTGVRRIVHVGKNVTDVVLRRTEEHASAVRDPLTGLLNRRGGEAVLEAARGEAQATSGTFSIVMCDLDHFKSVNDVHGHAVGDVVLGHVAQVLTAALHEHDAAVRWGGEEFLLVLPGVTRDAAMAIAERVRGSIAAASAPSVGTTTASLGVAEWFPAEGLASVVSRADRALYAAKNAGRNRVSAAKAPESRS